MNVRTKTKQHRRRIYALPRVRARSLNPRCAAHMEDSGRWLHAFAIWRKLAGQGDAAAEIQAAYFYGLPKRKGKGIPCRTGSLGGRHAAELEAACIRRAAEAGNPQGQFLLAADYRYGNGGTSPNIAQALALYRQSAMQGYGLAAFALAEWYALGEGVPKNTELARHYAALARKYLPDNPEADRLFRMLAETDGAT